MRIGKVTDMNALPLKPGKSPADILDELIANHGARTVVLALASKLVKRTRPPDTTAGRALLGQPHVDGLDDRLRADIGLDPKGPPDPHHLLAHVKHRDIFHL
ncbi:MAG: hypothetical protein AAF340_09395 [Pseudomonadota bacterium]